MDQQRKLGIWVLTALVVGNMVGSGIFMLPRSLAEAASPIGVMFAWLLTGAGVLMTALVFGNLAIRKPDLGGGPQIYAKELFPKGSNLSILSGFMSSWGYWVGNFAGNVAIITTFASYLSTFFPMLTSSKTVLEIGPFALKLGNLLTFLVCTALLWGMHIIILRGVEGAGKLNFVATAAKVLGFFLFIVIALFAFDKAVIGPLDAPRYDGNGQPIGLLGQINNAALSTLWAFVGVESAMVFASRARKQADVKQATIAGLLIALAIYIGISFLVMGVLPQNKTHSIGKAACGRHHCHRGTGGRLRVGWPWADQLARFDARLDLVERRSAVPSGETRDVFAGFLKENRKGAPSFSLTLSNALAQLFIFSTISHSMATAFDFVIYIATLAYLVPYLIASVFQLKLTLTGETYAAGRERLADGIVAALATLYSVWVVIAGTADMKTFLLGVALLASGVIFYPQVKKAAQQANEKQKLSA
ncbi:Arginine/ornithine antiporter [Geobacillus sp. BCO2]|nr:Arginine/ornithine antiporter [Geobacillus sp. BCO2]